MINKDMNEDQKLYSKATLENLNAYPPDELVMTNTQMLISIANSLKDIADSLKKIEDK
jgi:hypothetical protein